MLFYQKIELCKTEKGFRGIPNININLVLLDVQEDISNQLKKLNFELKRATKVALLYINNQTSEKITLFSTAKTMLYNVSNSEKAQELFAKLAEIINGLNVT